MKKIVDSIPPRELAAACDRAWEALVRARASYLSDVSAHYDE
ncbi:hypothetical protein [Streptomyces sp. NBC_00145]